MIITADFLTRAGANPAGAAAYGAALADACQRRGITTTARLTPFLANVLNESAALTRAEEDMIYTSPTWLHEVYPSRFPTVAAATPYVRNPDALAAKVYGTTGGIDLRGRGLAQLTGTANYAAYAKAIGKQVPELAAYLVTPEGAADSAAWFYVYRGCLLLADAGNLLGVTKLWEGASAIGWASVQTWHNQVLRAAGVSAPAAKPAPAKAATAAVASPPAADHSSDALNDAVLAGTFTPTV